MKKYLFLNNRNGARYYTDSIKIAMKILFGNMRGDFREYGQYSVAIVRTSDKTIVFEKEHPQYSFDRWYEFLNKAE